MLARMLRYLLPLIALAGCKGDARLPGALPTTAEAARPEAARPETSTSRRFAEAGTITPGAQAVVVRPDSSVVAVGGRTPKSPWQARPDVWLFDPRTSAWRAGPPLGIARNDLTALVLADGALLVFGGTHEDREVAIVERLDAGATSWKRVAPMPAPAHYLAAVVLPSGSVFAATGQRGYDCVANAWLYDPAKDHWATVTPALEGRIGADMVLDGSGSPVVLGGDCQGVRDVRGATSMKYDIAHDAWSEGTLSVALGAAHMGVLALGDGTTLVAGGLGVGAAATSTVAILDANGKTWKPVAAMLSPRMAVTLARVGGGSILAYGGTDDPADLHVELYDVRTQRWFRGPELPAARHHETHAVSLRDGRVLVVAGFDAMTEIYSGQTWLYGQESRNRSE